MSYDRIINALIQLGLSEKEARIYLHLACCGPQEAKNIADQLRIEKHQLSLNLKSLQDKKIVTTAIDYSTRFSALPFEKAINVLEEAKKEEAQAIEQNREEILSNWRTIIRRHFTG